MDEIYRSKKGRLLHRYFFDYVGSYKKKNIEYYALYCLWNDGTYECAALLPKEALVTFGRYVAIGTEEDYLVTCLKSIGELYVIESIILKK